MVRVSAVLLACLATHYTYLTTNTFCCMLQHYLFSVLPLNVNTLYTRYVQ